MILGVGRMAGITEKIAKLNSSFSSDSLNNSRIKWANFLRDPADTLRTVSFHVDIDVKSKLDGVGGICKITPQTLEKALDGSLRTQFLTNQAIVMNDLKAPVVVIGAGNGTNTDHKSYFYPYHTGMNNEKSFTTIKHGSVRPTQGYFQSNDSFMREKLMWGVANTKTMTISLTPPDKSVEKHLKQVGVGWCKIPKNAPDGTVVVTGGMNGCSLRALYDTDTEQYYFMHDKNSVSYNNEDAPPSLIERVRVGPEYYHTAEVDRRLSRGEAYAVYLIIIKRAGMWEVHKTGRTVITSQEDMMGDIQTGIFSSSAPVSEKVTCYTLSGIKYSESLCCRFNHLICAMHVV